MNESLSIQTSITSTYLQSSLFKGFGFALIGLLLLIISGAFLPEHLMQHWGWIIYFTSFFLITFGLLHYRKMTRLQNKPNEIKLTTNNQIEFWSQGHYQFGFSTDTIESISFKQTEKKYGIICALTQFPLDLPKNYQRFYVEIEGKEPKLFFKYFSKRSCAEFQEFLNREQTNDD